jgi:4-hydroxythreonine-4-phosphate dehydrogenase
MTLAADGKPLVLTMGEPAGIGIEITLRAWLGRADGVPPFAMVADQALLARTAEDLGLAVSLAGIEAPEAAAEVFAGALPVLHQPLAAMVVPGRPDPANAPAVRTAIERAVRLALEGRAAGVVTNPIHKHVMSRAGFSFPGHTEFLGALADAADAPVMMLACPGLRTVPVTVHVSLAEAVRTLRRDRIVAAAETTRAALVRDFAIPMPTLAVAGLNPHAGEQGDLGSEERDVIGPAIEDMRAAGIDAFGPVSPDTLFAAHMRERFDAAICMYHDQALIPIKTLGFDEGVNVTLGLPFVRTSPDHGTALDIAGTGRASARSLVAALGLAVEMAGNRVAAGAEPP